MTRGEIESDIIDLILIAHSPTKTPVPEATLADLGFDCGLDCLEILMTLEDRFGERPFINFMPTPETTLNQIIGHIEQATTGAKG